MKNTIIRYKALVHVSKDTKELPSPIRCGKCLNRIGRGHGKSRLFRSPREKFFHLKEIHKIDSTEFPSIQEELADLETLSRLSQWGILGKW